MVAYTTTYNLKKPTVADDEDVWGGYLNDSMDLIDDVLDGTTPVTGIDINSGTIDNAVIGGTTPVAGTFTTLTANTSLGVTGNITVSGTVDGRDVAADGTKLDGIESGATADQTKADIDALGIAASTAATLATARNIALSGDVSGNVNFDGSGNVTITTTVADDSHNHVISNIDGLQTALDGKLSTSGKAADSNLLDGIDSSAFLRSNANDTMTGQLIIDASTDEDLILRGTSPYIRFQEGTTDKAYVQWSNAGYLYLRNTEDGSGVRIRDDIEFTPDGSNFYNIWHANNDGSGSGLDADNLDGYTWMSSGKNVRGTNIYADDWFRNYNSGEGLYNEATGAHFVSDATDQWTIRDSGNSMRLLFKTNGTTVRGAVYADNSNGIGFLDSDQNWAYRHYRDSRHEWLINNSEKMELNNSGLFLQDGSLREDYDALSGTSPTCNVNAGGAFSLSMSGNTTFTFTSPSSGYSTGFILQLTGNGSTVTWPSSVDWAGGTAPDAPASGETDIYVFWTRNGGTTWYGVQSIDAAA
jgi:hypothetical protein